MRDDITRKYFDESTVRVFDNTNGEFTSWFEGDLLSIVRLSGAPRDSILSIDYFGDNGFKLSATSPILEEPMVRLVLQHSEPSLPNLFISNSVFVLKSGHRRNKIGVRSLAIELFEAKETGDFSHVEVFAIGNVTTLASSNPSNQYSGYAVWPQLGFDGEIPPALKERSPELSSFKYVSEVLAANEGLRLWLTYGGDIRLRFDLKEHSASWVALLKYLSDNDIKVTP